MKRKWLGLIALLTLGALTSCAGTLTIMQTAPSSPKGLEANPKISALSLEQWEQQKPSIKALLQDHIYGRMPQVDDSAPIKTQDRDSFSAFNDSASVTESILTLAPNGGALTRVPMVFVTPKNATGPVPIIIMENFCPNHAVIPVQGLTKPSGDYFDCNNDTMTSRIFSYFFGRYITTPPIEMIMKRGYALAVIHPPQFIPDRAQEGLAALQRTQPALNGRAQWGAIGAWAWEYSRAVDALEADPRFSSIIAYGHSRYGKSALLAAAFDDRIDAVIAHQSGTGGASLSRGKQGESVTAITQAYPHWFTPKYASYGENQSALPIDQHHMLALIAPRPIMLGNAKRDVWSDPEGAFRAAKGANPAYKVYGSDGLSANALTQFNPQDDIAFWLRPGTHGVVTEDWPAFLEFLDAHFREGVR